MPQEAIWSLAWTMRPPESAGSTVEFHPFVSERREARKSEQADLTG